MVLTTVAGYVFASMSEPRRWPVPWVFSVLILPLGVYTGFITTPLPFLLSKAGVQVEAIARITGLISFKRSAIELDDVVPAVW